MTLWLLPGPQICFLKKAYFPKAVLYAQEHAYMRNYQVVLRRYENLWYLCCDKKPVDELDEEIASRKMLRDDSRDNVNMERKTCPFKMHIIKTQ
ncbi:hypothetical protein CJU89_4842 [Yarrowia sp. B02]|nr:hypothetical protein CJU89_4842 [Yarrowia sp. B02]